MTTMERVALTRNHVVFLEEPHEYWLGEKQLHGITTAIRNQLESARKEYAGCPEYLIGRAGAYGRSVHKGIENLINSFEHDGTVEVEDFKNLTRGMTIEAAEYNVTDGEYWSSNIDLVTRISENEFALYDIKTYSGRKLTRTQTEKAKFQLSIYKMLFLIQNPEAVVRTLGIIHICNKPKKDGTVNHISEIIPVEEIPAEICKSLLDAERNGELFQNPYDIPKAVASKARRIIRLLNLKKETEEELNAIRKDVLETMTLLDVKNWKGEHITFTRVDESSRSTFDLAAFKKAYPDLPYESFVKTSKVGGSLKIAI